MFHLEWLFLMQLMMGVLMIVFLQKLNQMKKQVDEITKEVENYISYITEEVEEEMSSTKREYKEDEKAVFTTAKTKREEEQSRLIQEILGEYFV